jgi:flavin reductase (NADH)/cob(II)yrinic acid a,c-diamide reductase
MTDDATLAFRKALSAGANTVFLVTYRTAEGDVEGMTATAVMSLSLTPPSLLVAIGHQARARDAIRQRGVFGLSALRDVHVEIARAAGQSGGNKSFGGALVGESDLSRAPVLADALAAFHCRVQDAHEHFTHTLFVAEVLEAHAGVEGSPLLHYRGGYFTVGATLPSE